MPAPLVFSTHAEKVRHTYRALLRAATYLPDSLARAYIHNHILYRFRDAHIYKNIITAPQDEQKRIRERLKTAAKQARQLEAAGNGNLRLMQKVLMLVHGRQGKRKRELIQDLLRPDEESLPNDDSALEDIINEAMNPAEPTEPAKPEPHWKTPPAKLTLFVASQMRHQPEEFHLGTPKSSRPKIPAENMWERPFPVKRALNFSKKWYAETLERLFPPIPLNEFNRLRDLSLGNIPLEPVPVRRKRPRDSEVVVSGEERDREERDREERDREVLDYIKFPRLIEDSELDRIYFDTERQVLVRESKTPETSDGGIGTVGHKPTSRAIRRMYGTIWSVTAVMTQDPTTKQWNIEWGGGKGATHRGAVTPASEADMALFEGLDKLPQPVGEKGRGNRRGDRRSRGSQDQRDTRLTEKTLSLTES